MKISFNTRFTADKIRDNDGYGYGTKQILASLNRLGHTITENDASAEVGFCFDQPQHWKYFGNQYRVALSPWESTVIFDDWKVKMNECDEVWSPSPLIGEWYQKHNDIVKPVFTYEHGIDSVWAPKPRDVNGPLKFLHIGGEAYRKGLPETLKAWRAAFQGNKDVQLTCKLGATGFNLDHHGNVKTICGKMPFNELLGLHYDHNVFVYPSWGEGFGFNPFQALATGMPTVMTADWAPYRRFVDPMLTVKAELVDSPWPSVHPGKMFRPEHDDLVDRLRWVHDNYEERSDFAQIQAPLIHEDYAWDVVTKSSFEKLEKRLQNR